MHKHCTVLCFMIKLHNSSQNLRSIGFSSSRRQSSDQRNRHFLTKVSFAVQGGAVVLKRGCSELGWGKSLPKF